MDVEGVERPPDRVIFNPSTPEEKALFKDLFGGMLAIEEKVRRFIETLLIDIHWQGKRSDHPHDAVWLESRVKSLMPQAMLLFQATEREAMEKCLTYIETAWLDKDGMLIAVDGKDFLDDVRNTLIEELEKK